MTLMLPLTPEREQRLTQEANRLGVAPEDYALRLLREHLPPPQRQAELVALLESWIKEEDADEQKQTGDYLLQALDEDRPSQRKLFPPEREGVTW